MDKENKNKPDACEIENKKRKHTPTEDNTAAAWAEIDKQKSDGKVPVPSIDNVKEAKDWIEENKK